LSKKKGVEINLSGGNNWSLLEPESVHPCLNLEHREYNMILLLVFWCITEKL